MKNGTLPSVSWIVPPLAECEHPAAPPEWGEYLVQQILNILVSNPDVWAQTVFIVNYDENGGFFDHVPPPAAPAGTAGEYLTGTLPTLGGRHRRPGRPRLPHPGAGHLAVQRRRLQVLGHPRPHRTLRLIETRFGVTVPNLSAWRRSVTGDFTGALNLTSSAGDRGPRAAVHLDRVEPHRRRGGRAQRARPAPWTSASPYPLPTSNSMPAQETTPVRPAVP